MNFPSLFLKALELSFAKQTSRVMYSIVNGGLTDPSPVGNGGKQGDPLFKLVYVTVVEALFAALEANEQTGEYQGIQTPCPTRKFPHACMLDNYADDTLAGIGSMLPLRRCHCPTATGPGAPLPLPQQARTLPAQPSAVAELQFNVRAQKCGNLTLGCTISKSFKVPESHF